MASGYHAGNYTCNMLRHIEYVLSNHITLRYFEVKAAQGQCHDNGTIISPPKENN